MPRELQTPKLIRSEPDGTGKEPLCVDFDLSSSSASKTSLSIFLTLSAFIQELKSPVGVLSVGLRKFVLELKILGGSMPISTRKPEAELRVKVEKSVNLGISTSAKKSKSEKGAADAKASVKDLGFEVSQEIENSDEKQSTSTETYQFVRNDWQLISGGFETSPFWCFNECEGHDAIQGSLKQMLIGNMCWAEPSCSAIAEIRAFGRDLFLAGRTGLLWSDLNSNHQMARWITVQFWLRHRIQPHLNRKVYEVRQ